MRIIAGLLTFLFLLATAVAQEAEQWKRVYYFEGAHIDLDQTDVIVGSQLSGRVRFRIAYERAIPVPDQKNAKYKSAVQTVEFKCPERQYRVLEVQRFDGKGNVVDSDKATDPVAWKEVKSASIMDKLIIPACELIKEKRRDP